ncbi:MAG: hypothetical protein GY913_14415 [Proteobacteria bacterium]|nr:hypothetical protein [Pseudomonadota bacterium]MCP4918103.1 hypothetical protein [Pseudomonadota bacterium]
MPGGFVFFDVITLDRVSSTETVVDDAVTLGVAETDLDIRDQITGSLVAPTALLVTGDPDGDGVCDLLFAPGTSTELDEVLASAAVLESGSCDEITRPLVAGDVDGLAEVLMSDGTLVFGGSTVLFSDGRGGLLSSEDVDAVTLEPVPASTGVGHSDPEGGVAAELTAVVRP